MQVYTQVGIFLGSLQEMVAILLILILESSKSIRTQKTTWGLPWCSG